MMTWFRGEPDLPQDLGRDPVVAEALEVMDPAAHEPNYWFRFQERVMTGAASELARRRMMVNVTVVEVMASWSRTVVPTALLAAAVATLLLVRADAGMVEQALVADDRVAELPGEVVPVVQEGGTLVAFASFGPDNF